MNNSGFFLPNLWRFLGLWAVQGLVLIQIPSVVGYSLFNVILYPLFIFFLPMSMPRAGSVALGFLIGLMVDFVYGSPGIHASAGAFSGYVRPTILGFFCPARRVYR